MTRVVTPTPDTQVIVVAARRDELAIWLHPRATIASRLLGARTATALGAHPGAIRSAALSSLDPDRERRASALVEVGGARYERIADELTRALGEQPAPFDIWHEVPLVQQLTGMSCWAAAAAMVVGWRDCTSLDDQDVAAGAGHWTAYREGLEPREVESFARKWGLVVARPPAITIAALRRLLEDHGPLWVGEASPSLHVVVLAGMYGDGTHTGTFVRIADPWPIGRGHRYTIPFSEFRQNLLSAAALSGGRPQFLHTAPGVRRQPAAWR